MWVTAGHVHVCALEHCRKHDPNHNPASTSAFNPPSCTFWTPKSTFYVPHMLMCFCCRPVWYSTLLSLPCFSRNLSPASLSSALSLPAPAQQPLQLLEP